MARILTAVLLFFLPFSAALANPAERSRARIASSGDGYLVTWVEGSAVYGARLTSEGLLLDRPPLFIGAGSSADVVWTGGNYLVASLSAPGVMNVTTVSRDGLVGQRTTSVSTDPSSASVEMAFAGTTVLVHSESGNRWLFAADGSLIQELPQQFSRSRVAVSAAPGSFMQLEHAFNFVLIYTISTDTGRVKSSGSVGFSPLGGVVDPVHATGLAVASDGLHYLRVWTTGILYTARDTPDAPGGGGAFTQPKAQTFDVGATSPRAAWRGDEYLVTYVAEGRFHILRFSAEVRSVGKPITGEPVRDEEAAPIAVAGGGRGAIAWIRSDSDIRVGLFDSASIAEPETPFYAVTDVTRRLPRRRAVR